MKQIRSFSLAVLSALLFSVWLAPAVQAQETGLQNDEYRVAQQEPRDEEYLPPWQRQGDDGQYEEDPSAPEPISPRSSGRSGEPPRDYDRYEDQTNAPPRYDDQEDYDRRRARDPEPPIYEEEDSYSSNEIVDAGHRFFGGVSKGLAKVVEYVFSQEGRPNGYILGDEAGGAFVAGLRYGEGTLYTKNAGTHRVYWQGPSIGYDFGAEGSKTMILVYNLRHVDQIYHRFAGVDGSAYFVGGVGVTFQSHDDIVLAPIRSGVGLRLGANVGYLKYTRSPTWNPF